MEINEIVTRRDLEAFGQKLIQDFAEMLKQKKVEPEKQYLRSREVRKMLGGISAGTLQSLRVKGVLKPVRIEGTFFYKVDEIKTLLNGNNE